jgi:hypothetical protein
MEMGEPIMEKGCTKQKSIFIVSTLVMGEIITVGFVSGGIFT